MLKLNDLKWGKRTLFPVKTASSLVASLLYGDVEKRFKIEGFDLVESPAERVRKTNTIRQLCLDRIWIESFDFTNFNRQHSFDVMVSVM
jgi:hypothetical protein